MKKILVLLMAAIMVLSMCACGSENGASATAAPAGKTDAAATPAARIGTAKDTAILATSDEPYRFFAQSKQSCSGADNLVLSNVYDCLLRLEADGSLTPAL